jgi:hypothetical protein
LPANRPNAVIAFAYRHGAIGNVRSTVDETMKQFVAMTDDVLYRPDDLPGPLVPYRCGVFCWHRLREEAGAIQGGPLESATRNVGEETAALSA